MAGKAKRAQSPSPANSARPAPVELTVNAMKPLGILGGGQLARMMVLKAHELGLPIAVLSENHDDPAAQVAPLWRQGSLESSQTLEEFLRACSLVTFESEFLDAHLLSQLEARTGTPIFPRPQDMATIQDRLSQKELLARNEVRTSEFMPVANAADADHAFSLFDGRVVFKKRRFGYDGYGTFVVRSQQELAHFKNNQFKNEPKQNPHGFIAERFIKFRRELAVMIARTHSGKLLRLPFVETFQEASRCLWVKGPLRPTPELERTGRSLERLLARTGYVGIMGIEIFDSSEGFIVNELAPRVHNSGHYSLDALNVDQFTLHLKAILGLELGSPKSLAKGFAMYNLLGSHSEPPHWRLPADISLHWYGKKQNRPGRKMGHINALAESPEQALRLLRRRRKSFEI